MYIVTRTFRDANGLFKVGSVVEPTGVKAFKSRLQQRHIVDVNEQNVERWSQYFINRHGIDLTDVLTGVANVAPVPQEPVVEEVVHEELQPESGAEEGEEASEEVTEADVTEESTGQLDSLQISW